MTDYPRVDWPVGIGWLSERLCIFWSGLYIQCQTFDKTLGHLRYVLVTP